MYPNIPYIHVNRDAILQCVYQQTCSHLCIKEMEKSADSNIVHNSLDWAKSFKCSSSINGINKPWYSQAMEHYALMKRVNYWYLQKPR